MEVQGGRGYGQAVSCPPCAASGIALPACVLLGSVSSLDAVQFAGGILQSHQFSFSVFAAEPEPFMISMFQGDELGNDGSECAIVFLEAFLAAGPSALPPLSGRENSELQGFFGLLAFLHSWPVPGQDCAAFCMGGEPPFREEFPGVFLSLVHGNHS